MNHLDETGAECTRHAANVDALLTFAVIGSRVATFNHDIASKLQGLMMSLDEIDEMLDRIADPHLRRATETAQQAIKEASTLLSANRSLTRSSKAKLQLRDVVKSASERSGVGVLGSIPDAQADVAALTTHALGLALDAIGGTGKNRIVDVVATIQNGRARLVFTSAAEPTKSAGDAFALAAFAIARAGGELRCRDNGFVVQLPLI